MRATILQGAAILSLLTGAVRGGISAEYISVIAPASQVISYHGPEDNATAGAAWYGNGTELWTNMTGASVSATVLGDNVVVFGTWAALDNFALQVDGTEMTPVEKDSQYGRLAQVEGLANGPHAVVVTAKKPIGFDGFGAGYDNNKAGLTDAWRYVANDADYISANGTWTSVAVGTKWPDMVTSNASSAYTFQVPANVSYFELVGSAVVEPGAYAVTVSPPPPWGQTAYTEYHPERSSVPKDAFKAATTSWHVTSLHTVGLDGGERYTVTITFLDTYPRKLALRRFEGRKPAEKVEKKKNRPFWLFGLFPIFVAAAGLVGYVGLRLYKRYKLKHGRVWPKPAHEYPSIDIRPYHAWNDGYGHHEDELSPIAAAPAALGQSHADADHELPPYSPGGLPEYTSEIRQSLPVGASPSAQNTWQNRRRGILTTAGFDAARVVNDDGTVPTRSPGARPRDSDLRSGSAHSSAAPLSDSRDTGFRPLGAWVGDSTGHTSHTPDGTS